MTREFILSDCSYSSNLGTFRGNSNILLISCDGNEIRMISTKSGAILNTMSGVKTPADYFVLGKFFPSYYFLNSTSNIFRKRENSFFEPQI